MTTTTSGPDAPQPDRAATSVAPGSANASSQAAGRPGPTSTSAPAAKGAAAESCTGPKAPIVLGSVGTQSGVIGTIIGSASQAVQAWAAALNAKGGIHCHPVKYLLADDGGDPARHQALVRQMVERDNVVAFLQMNAPLTGQASVAYLNSKRIPVIGSEGGSNWFNENPLYFPATSSGDPTVEAVYAAAAAAGRAAGKAKYGVFSCIEAQLCSRVGDLLPGYMKKYSGQVVYKAQGSLVQPDFTAACQAAKNAGVEVQVLYLDGNSVQRFARSCKSIDFRPLYVVPALAMTPQLPGDPNLDGLQGGVVTAPWTLTNVPAIAEHQRVITQYAAGVTPNAATMQGWVAAKLFEAATSDVADPTTSEAILEGLWRVKGNDLGGLTYPLTFTKGQNAAKAFCVWPAVIRGGKYSSTGLDGKICANG